MNNLTLGADCNTTVERADIEESNGVVAKIARTPQASYPCGNFSDTSVNVLDIAFVPQQRILRTGFRHDHLRSHENMV